jgi:protocatechuate 3,4-dioxygenase beta subunit
MNTENEDGISTPSAKGESRRAFIKLGAVAAIGSILIPKWIMGRPPLMPIGCVTTSPDILGPFYLAGAPVTNQIADLSDPGTRLAISGTVYGPDCTTPVSGAQLDVWHADDAGDYDMTAGYNMRGKVIADGNGVYAYETIMPGRYLNGATYRPSHIHIIATAPSFTSLTTQLYFEGDPYIATDPWASDPDAAMRIIPLSPDGSGGSTGVFDIVLDAPNSVSPYKEHSTMGVLLPNAPNPFSESTTIYFNVFKRMHVTIRITDVEGREVAMLVNEEKNPDRHLVSWNPGGSLANGMYVCILSFDGKPEASRRLILQR